MAKPAIATFCLHLQWWVIAAILFFTTVAFGGVHAPAIYVVRLLICLSLILQLIVFLCQDAYWADFHRSLFFPVFVFVTFLVLICTQYFFGVDLLRQSTLGTINRAITFDSMIQLSAYFIFFIICVKMASKQDHVERLGTLIAVLVFVISLLGLVQQLTPNERILWKRFSDAKGVFFGPFINQNHFGGFLALTFPLALGIMHYRFYQVKREHEEESSQGASWRILVSLMSRGVVFLFFLTTLTLAACVLSRSRVSAIVLVFCCVAYFALYAIGQRNRSFYVTLIAVLAGAFLFTWWLADETLVHQFQLTSLGAAWQDRIEVFKRSLPLFYQFPLFGSGLGTFFLLSPKAFLPHMNYVSWHHAHNDYLELLVETGMGGFILFICSILSLLIISFYKNRNSPSLWSGLMANQAFVAIFGIAVIEIADFHLKVPANALLFAFQLAVLFQASYPRGEHDQELIGGKSGRRGKFLKWVVPVGALSGLAFLAVFSTRDYLASRLAQAESNRLSNLERAVELRPTRADLWYELGQEYDRTSKELQYRSENLRTLQGAAVSALRKAAALSPSYAPYWYRLGVLEYTLGYEKEGIASLEKSVYWSPGKLRNSIYLLGIYLRESEKTAAQEEKNRILGKAQALYEQLRKLETVPSDGEYRNWMGDYYFDRLQQLRVSWTSL